MTERVDFYVLASNSPKQRFNFACRLTEKAYQRDLKVLILQDSLAGAKSLDELLWTFNERSFVPHQVCIDGRYDAETPVHLALESANIKADLLVNLTDRLPGGFEQYPRIAEIIDADPERRRLGRERFKAYRDLKVALDTHQLDESAEI
ncbi:MAG TPA: DNA polymerase III subunit chi [Steroidobacteraceae bacterium]|jgi:DNA polymerase-3 subunit chi